MELPLATFESLSGDAYRRILAQRTRLTRALERANYRILHLTRSYDALLARAVAAETALAARDGAAGAATSQ